MKVASKSGILYNSKLSSTAELIVARFPPQSMHCVCASARFISGVVLKNVKSVPSYVNETVWAGENRCHKWNIAKLKITKNNLKL